LRHKAQSRCISMYCYQFDVVLLATSSRIRMFCSFCISFCRFHFKI